MLRKKLNLLATGVLIAAIGLGGAAAPALAVEDTPDDQSPSSTDGICSNGWIWVPVARDWDSVLEIGPLQSNYNGTTSSATSTFTSTASGTQKIIVDGGLNVGAEIKVVSASAEFGLGLETSMTASLGNQISITIPAKQYGFAQYGIWSTRIEGEERRMQGIGQVCNVVETRPSGFNAPFRVGWDTWTSPNP